MLVTSKRKLRKRLNTSGKKAGQVLVDWLNCEGSYGGTKGTSAHHRIESFLEEWRSLASLPVTHWGEEEGQKFEELQRKLSRYRMSPQIDSNRMGSLGMRFTWNAGPSDEAKAVLVITWLGERGLLWRIRRCGHGDISTLLAKLKPLGIPTVADRNKKPACCGKWFYARRRDQKFCGSPVCRQRAYASKTKTPAARAKRAEYMRGYRHAERERDERILAQIRNPERKSRKEHAARKKANNELHAD